MRRWLPLLGLLLVVVVALGLRFYRIDAQSLWYDEGISAFQLNRSFGDILYAASRDSHPPLYYWTLKAWGETFSSSELGLRSLSAVWGVLMVVLTWLIARRLFGSLVATLAALLLAVAPLAVYYAQEVRMYTQVTALALLATWAYLRRTYWLYALAGIATVYSQYLGLAMLAAIGGHAVLTFRSRTRRDWLWFLAASGAIGLAFLPWLPTFRTQQGAALNTSPRTPLGLVLDSLTAYGGGLASGDVLVVAGGVLVGLALIALVLERDWQRTSLPLLLWLAPLTLVVTLALRMGLFEVRYLLLGMPGLMILAGLGIVRLTRHPVPAVVVAGGLLVPAWLGLTQQYFDPRLARDDYRGVVQTIVRDAQPTDAIVLSAPNQVEVFNYYYRGGLATFPLPAQRPIDADDTRRRLEAIRGEHQRIWLVSWAMNEADPPGYISSWLADNGFKATHDWYGSVQLSLVGLAPADAQTEQLDLHMDNGIVLEGYRIGNRSLKPGETLALTLLWRADQPIGVPWKVFTHLLDAHPKVVAQRDAEPAANLRPTTTWQPGERIEDNYGILVPEDLAAGTYTLEIGMYNGELRANFGDRGDHLLLGTVSVGP